MAISTFLLCVECYLRPPGIFGGYYKMGDVIWLYGYIDASISLFKLHVVQLFPSALIPMISSTSFDGHLFLVFDSMHWFLYLQV